MTDFDIAAWTRQLGKTVDSAHEAGLMDDIQAHLMRVHLGFCRAHQLAFRMPGDDVDLWGFGTASVLFAQPDGHHWWTDLVDLIEPTGLTWTDLKRAYRAEVRMHYGDTATLHYNVDGFHHDRQILADSAVLRIMFSSSVWAREMQHNLFGAFRLGIVESGLGNALGPVQLYDEHGQPTGEPTTFADWMAAGGLPSPEEARAQAFAGPAGALQQFPED